MIFNKIDENNLPYEDEYILAKFKEKDRYGPSYYVFKVIKYENGEIGFQEADGERYWELEEWAILNEIEAWIYLDDLDKEVDY